MNFDEWSYENLCNVERELEDAIREGQPLKGTLLAVKKEMSQRRFALVAILGTRIRKEYGRWKTRERCEAQAKAMSLPLGTKFEYDGQQFYTEVIELF